MLKKDGSLEEIMFVVTLGTENWHIVPHPSEEDTKDIILPLLEEIVNWLKADKEIKKIKKKNKRKHECI